MDSTQRCQMDPRQWDGLCRRRLRDGDYDPLWIQWGRLRMIRDPDITQGIPDHWSHPKIQQYLESHDWDVGTIPNDKIQALADRIETLLTEKKHAKGSRFPDDH